MTIHPLNIFSLPLLLIVWAADAYLLLCLIRALVPATKLATSIAAVTDPLPRYIGEKLTKWRRRPTPYWAAWLITMAVVFFTRHAIVALVIAIN